MSTVTLSIPSISCAHCVHTIKTELGTIRGVKSVEGNETTKKVTVQFEPPATLDIIRDVLTKIDYTPENI